MPQVPTTHSARAPADDLAVFSGNPAFDRTLQTGRPNVLDPDAVAALVDEAMARHWLTNDGPLVRELEECFADFQGVRHAVAVSSATTGLQLAARALDLAGDVVMPAFTFVGTAHAMTWMGLRPVFCDVSPDTHTLDPVRVEAAITGGTGAILGVHLWGHACDVDGLQGVADRHGLPLLFDAAHATGSSYGSAPIGRFGRVEVFSLHATKSINGLEGGILATNDDALAERLRLLRNFGFVAEDTVVTLGINGKMNEFSAAMALANLDGYDRLLVHNRAVRQAYRDGLAGLPGISLVEGREGDSHSQHYAVVDVSGAAGISRDTLCRVLAAENVVARRYFRPGCHRLPPYNAADPGAPLPVTERLSESLMQLPTGLQLQPAEAARIATLVAAASACGHQIEAVLESRRGGV